MGNEPSPVHGVMEGKGAYNRHARVPAGGMALALPLLEKTVREMELDGGEQSIAIADYGSSQGKNSLSPMQVAIDNLRPRLGPDRPIFVFHVDQPYNDFNTLFEVLETDPGRYSLDDPQVFPCAIGRSFYERVLPAASVTLGWSSYAAVWLSRIPTRITGHFSPFRSTGPERAAFERQAAEDWRAFLSLRAAELRPGGRLVVVLPALNDDGVSGFEELMDEANDVLAEMVEEGAIRAEERERMVLATYPRRMRELRAPFNAEEHFQGLSLESCELLPLPDAAWADYERDGNEDALAMKHALFFRSIFVPSLAQVLSEAHDAERRRIFTNQVGERLKTRLARQPRPKHSFVQTMVAIKGGSSSIRPAEDRG